MKMMNKVFYVAFFLQFTTSNSAFPETLEQQRVNLIKKIKSRHLYSPEILKNLDRIIKRKGYISQGNPEVTQHPKTISECKKKIDPKSVGKPQFTSICKDHFMAPLYKKNQGMEQAKVCIDQFEFPNIPCEYPVVWVRAVEAQEICKAVGKRLCDASEWEQACAGEYTQDRYLFAAKNTSVGAAHNKQRRTLNRTRQKVWAYGKKQDHKLCGTGSRKSQSCDKALRSGKSVWKHCGSNTYPSGYFPKCKSKFEVYDQHGNAAEHMNLPLYERQLSREGYSGHVEMKGSWFIFASISAHPDDCHWRAPYWHGTPVNARKSHHNYHLGFRCCKDIR